MIEEAAHETSSTERKVDATQDSRDTCRAIASSIAVPSVRGVRFSVPYDAELMQLHLVGAFRVGGPLMKECKKRRTCTSREIRDGGWKRAARPDTPDLRQPPCTHFRTRVRGSRELESRAREHASPKPRLSAEAGPNTYGKLDSLVG